MTQFCSVTGLSVFSKPEWRHQNVSQTFEANFWTIGDSIVYSLPKGVADLKGVQKSLAINDTVIKSISNTNTPLVQIEDYALLKGSNYAARRYLAKKMNAGNQSAILFCNASLPLSIAIKIGKRFNTTNKYIHVAKTYTEAIREAVEVIGKKGLKIDDSVLNICKSFDHNACSLSCVDLFSKDRWQIKTQGYCNKSVVVDHCILHSIAEGIVESKHIPLIENSYNQCLSDLPEKSAIAYMVVDARKLKGGSRAGRAQFMQCVKRWHKRSPLRMYIVYNANIFMKTALQLAKPLMPFKVKIAEDIHQAFQFIHRDKDRAVSIPIPVKKKAQLTVSQWDIENLMGLISRVNWEKGGIPDSVPVEEGHPFYFLYQSIKLIKEELDDLFAERKHAEEEKIKAQKFAGEQKKLALVGQIAGKMAHDFNNVLAVIMGNAQLLILDSREPKTRKTLELIFEQTIRGKNLTRNLVAFARDQEPRQEFFKINEKLDLVLTLLKKDLCGIELIREDKPDLPELLADPGMIEHALVNLVQNSIHATSLSEHPRIIIRTYRRDNNICFEIEDNGCGIPKEYLENIYDPSFTLKGSRDITGSYKTDIKGTGYGMANVKKYIQQHKGNIFVASEAGSGTRFKICLPVIKKELTPIEKAEIKKGKLHFDRYILLVEDEPAISDVQYRILTQDPFSHRVDIANTGRMAMDLFNRNKYDLVSLDYLLPGQINGMDVYHHIRAADKAIPILFVSGNIEFLESIKLLKQKDANLDHLSKPCQNKAYVNGVNNLFERS